MNNERTEPQEWMEGYPNDPENPFNRIDRAVDEVFKTVPKVRQALPWEMMPDHSMHIPDNIFFRDEDGNLQAKEGANRQLAESASVFGLSNEQVENEARDKIALNLARRIAREMSRFEDELLIYGEKAKPPQGIEVSNQGALGSGLWNMATTTISVPLLNRDNPHELWSTNIIKAVVEAISHLWNQEQTSPFRLLIPPQVYADIYGSVNNNALGIQSIGDRLNALLEGSTHQTGALFNTDSSITGSSNTGILIATGGLPISIIIGQNAFTQFDQKRKGHNFFRMSERINFDASDERAVVALKFEEPSAGNRQPGS